MDNMLTLLNKFRIQYFSFLLYGLPMDTYRESDTTTRDFYFSGKYPVPIRCSVAWAFNFTPEGNFPFKTRNIGGITKESSHDVWGRAGQFSCKQNISWLAVCDIGI